MRSARMWATAASRRRPRTPPASARSTRTRPRSEPPSRERLRHRTEQRARAVRVPLLSETCVQAAEAPHPFGQDRRRVPERRGELHERLGALLGTERADEREVTRLSHLLAEPLELRDRDHVVALEVAEG